MFWFALMPIHEDILCLLLCLMCTRIQPHQIKDCAKGIALAACIYYKDPAPQILFPTVILAMIT